MKDKFLIIGASFYQHYIYDTLKTIGIKVYSVDKNPSSPMFKKSDYFSAIDIYDIDKIVKYVSLNKIKYISTINIDQAMFAVSEICKKSGLPYFSSDKLTISTNKEYMRKYWKKIKVNIPEFYVFSKYDFDKIVFFLKKTNKNEWIIKPVDNAAKRGISRISKSKDLKNLDIIFKSAIAASKTSRCILEEFIEGELFFVPTYISKNKTKIGLFDQEYNERFVQIRFNGPSKISKVNKKIIFKEAIKAVQDIGEGFYHTEVIFSKERGPFLIETSPRISYATIALSRIIDNFCPVFQLISDLTDKEYSYFENLDIKANHASLIHIIPKPGTVYNGYYDDYKEKKPGIYEIVPLVFKGHIVNKFITNADRVLYFVCYSDSKIDLEKKIKFYKKMILTNAFE